LYLISSKEYKRHNALFNVFFCFMLVAQLLSWKICMRILRFNESYEVIYEFESTMYGLVSFSWYSWISGYWWQFRELGPVWSAQSVPWLVIMDSLAIRDWKSDGSWMWTIKLVFCSGYKMYNVSTRVRKLHKSSLTWRDRGTLQICYPLWSLVMC
jgi:hypothetical protein